MAPYCMGLSDMRTTRPPFRGKNNDANDRHPHPCAGRRHDQTPAKGNSAAGLKAHADRCRQRLARSRRRALPAVPARRPRHGAPVRRHGGGRGRHACAFRHAADLAVQSGSRHYRRRGGNPKRRDCAAREGAPGSLCRHRHFADAGAATSRRRIAPRHDQARPARRHDRLQCRRQKSRRSELRAVMGDRAASSMPG